MSAWGNSWLKAWGNSWGQVGEVEEPRHTGGHGKKKLRWIERDGKILIFKTQEEVELFIEIENRNTEEPLTETEPVNIIKPVEVIDKTEIKQLSKAYGYQRKLYHADQVGNIERVIAIYKELQRREEDDIELILIGA